MKFLKYMVLLTSAWYVLVLPTTTTEEKGSRELPFNASEALHLIVTTYKHITVSHASIYRYCYTVLNHCTTISCTIKLTYVLFYYA